MKRLVATLLTLCLLTLQAACARDVSPPPPAPPVALTVVSTFGGNHANAEFFQTIISGWAKDSGNTVFNRSANPDETWKSSVINDFATGNEPDIIQFFSGHSATSIENALKLVSVEEIRRTYPDYLSNLKDSAFASTGGIEGEHYWAPTNGYWELTFVNLDILEQAGINDIPRGWSGFLEACEKIKAMGITPIGVELNSEPNHLFEYLLFNHAGNNMSAQIPIVPGDAASVNISAALADFKLLYDLGYFPANTATATREEVVASFAAKKSAFLPAGHRNRVQVETASTDPKTVAAFGFPSRDYTVRSPDSVMAGFETGFAVTRKAWNDPAKRGAVVELMTRILSDSSIDVFAGGGVTFTPTKADAIVSHTLSVFSRSCLDARISSGTVVKCAEDYWQPEMGRLLFTDLISRVCEGSTTIDDAIDELIAANHATGEVHALSLED
ncbi:hypothetical protein FACS1894217_10500 [Clostridia bacterium]|nr:hypothetical protein FACS1894217_10500 [Clostridia bacterium]